MKQTLHKLLCMLLVLTMLCSLVPAVLAEVLDHEHVLGTPVPDPEHAGQHIATCTLDNCTYSVPENCVKAAHWVTDTQTHALVCNKCGASDAPVACEKTYAPLTSGYHKQWCEVCGHIYVESEACRDSDNDTDTKCDICGAEMPPAETKTIIEFEPLATIEKPVGTTQENLDLPRSVTGTYVENGEKKTTNFTVSGNWTCTTYDANKPGIYIFTGTVSTDDYTLAEGVSATITVTVKVVGDYTLTLSANRSMTVGDTLNISAVVTKREGAAAASDLKVVWSIDATEKIAALSSKNTAVLSNAAVNSLKAISCGSSTSYKNVTVTAILKSGDTVLDEKTATVSIYPATASIIKVNALNGGVTFGEDAFYSALGYGFGSKMNFDFVTFWKPSSREGTLYSDSSRYGTKLTDNSKCYYGYNSKTDYDGYDLNTVYFEVAEKYTTSPITLTYTAYNTDGNVIANGSIEVSLLTSTIQYHVDAEGKVTFDEDDFRSVLRANYSGAALDYVQFDMSNAVFGNAYGGSGKYGYLYFDSTLKTKLTANNDTAKFKYNYKSSDSRNYYDLDDMTYAAGSATGKYTVTIPFTAYGTSSYQSVSGLVEIAVNETDAFTIGYTGTDFRAVNKVIADAYKSATCVMFSLPEEGTLYYNYRTINNYGHKVRSTYAYYLDPSTKDEYDLDDVYFVPAAGQTKASIRFDVYSGKTKIDSGSITFSIKGRTSSSVFTDVTYANTGSWSADSIDFMQANGLIYGTGKNKFNPTGTMTRGDLVLILYRLAGQPSVSGVKNPFKDVTSGDYYYKAVLWAYENDVVNGTGRDTFSPKNNVTREQLAAILYRYSGTPGTSTRLTGFTDAAKVSSYATNAMKWAVGAGIINGSGNKLDPQGSATRAQVAAMLHRYLTK